MTSPVFGAHNKFCMGVHYAVQEETEVKVHIRQHSVSGKANPDETVWEKELVTNDTSMFVPSAGGHDTFQMIIDIIFMKQEPEMYLQINDITMQPYDNTLCPGKSRFNLKTRP